MPRISTMNDRGVTLLETVISMLILFTALAVIPFLMQAAAPPAVHYSQNEQEIHTWFQQLTREAKYARNFQVENDSLIMTDLDGVERSYAQSGNRLIQRVDGTGFMIVLQEIDKFNVRRQGSNVFLTVEAGNQKYTKTLRRSLAPEQEDIWIKRVP